jgi:uncharacterized membrane protein YdfJ with MMPL/SSD domain
MRRFLALGIDYNIFLMARVREETLTHGTRDGMIPGLAVTGAVITSAGLVLAGTFSTLAVLPLVILTEIGFVIAVGVLIDTFVVRSLLGPSWCSRSATGSGGPRLSSTLPGADGRSWPLDGSRSSRDCSLGAPHQHVVR